MKKLSSAFLIGAIMLINPSAFAEGGAVNISIGSEGGALDNAALRKVRKVTAHAIAEGTVDTFYVYSPRMGGPRFREGGLSACAEAGFSAKPQKFKAFVQQLRGIHPKRGTFYNVDLTSACEAIQTTQLLSCGGIQGKQCPDVQQYCEFGKGQCRIADAQGTCKSKPEACTDQFKPVCGCDGETYGNACDAASAGVSIDSEGKCENPKK